MNTVNDITNNCFTKPTTLASFATSIIAFATSNGMTIDELAEATDISLVDFVNPNARVPDYAISALMNGVINRWPNAPISMEIAQSASISMLGGLAQGSQFAPDVEAVLTWWTKVHWLVADQAVSHIEQTASEFALVITHPSAGDNYGVVMEAGMGVHWRLLKAMTELDIPLIRVEFAHEKPVPVKVYEAFFQAPVSFRSDRNALVFSREHVRTPIRLANPKLFELIDHQLTTLRRTQNCDHDQYPLATLRQSIIANAARGEYGANAAATAANLGLRSAQRFAAQYDTSLQQLIDEVRLANARRFLSNPKISIEKVSQLVGYADARAFRRAFKRWTGLTPTTYRKIR